MFDELNPHGKHADFMSFYGDVCDNPRDPIERRIAVMQRRNIAFGKKGGGAPDPNPGMIASAESARYIADKQAATADEMLKFYKEQYADMKPIMEQITNTQVEVMNANNRRAEDYYEYEKGTFRPLEQGIVKDANEFATEGKREALATSAAADINTAMSNARSQEGRALSRMGVNPNSGRFAALNNQLSLGQAAASAGAMTKARNDAENMGFARKMDAASLGRNLASNSSTAYGISVGAGDSAGRSAQAGGNFMGQGYSSALQGMSGAASSYGTAGNIYGQEYQGRMQGYQADQAASGALWSGIGSMVGTMGGAYIMKPTPKAAGGQVRKSALKLADGAHVGSGPVSGPGGPVDDKIPAMLSDGEYVLPADTVQKVGKAKLDKLVKETHTPAAVQRTKKRKAIKGKK